MSRLFVDCDDTLILWADEPVGELIVREDYDFNLPLISDIACFINFHTDYELVVWSGGGIDYAARWAEKCFHNVPYLILPKDMRLPAGADICVDDAEVSPRDKRVRVLTSLMICPLCRAEELQKNPAQRG